MIRVDPSGYLFKEIYEGIKEAIIFTGDIVNNPIQTIFNPNYKSQFRRDVESVWKYEITDEQLRIERGLTVNSVLETFNDVVMLYSLPYRIPVEMFKSTKLDQINYSKIMGDGAAYAAVGGVIGCVGGAVIGGGPGCVVGAKWGAGFLGGSSLSNNIIEETERVYGKEWWKFWD